MKFASLFLIGILSLGSGSVVADERSENDPSGTWAWTLDVDGQSIESRLTVAWNGKKLRGTYSDQNVREKIQNGKFDGTNMSFDLEFNVDGSEVTVNFTGKTAKDKISGKAKVMIDGQENEFEINGERKTRAIDVAGDWKLEVETSDGESFMPTLTLEVAKGKLSGKLVLDEAGTHELKNVKLKKNVLTFELAGDAESDGSSFSSKFTGTPRGNYMEGKSELMINGATATAEVTGTRSKPEKKDKKSKDENK